MIDLTKLWQHRTILPVITVDFMSGKVLMHGYMNKEAFAYTLKTKKVWYYDPQTEDVEMKGEHSGNIQRLMKMKLDCDYNSLLVYVEQVGSVCKKDRNYRTCFIHDIYGADYGEISKHRKFGKVEVDENYDYSKEDYDDEYESD